MSNKNFTTDDVDTKDHADLAEPHSDANNFASETARRSGDVNNSRFDNKPQWPEE